MTRSDVSISESARARRGAPDRRRSLAVGVVVLALVVLGAGFGLSRLVVSRHRATPSLAAKASSSTSAASTTSTTAPRAATEYTVRSGDTITAIAVRYHVAPAAIVLANRLRGPDHLTIGQTLIIPPPPVVELVFRPATVAPGRAVVLTLTGAQPGELVRFAFSSPVGSFTGPRHVASARGEVAAAYTPGVDEPGGITTVVAIGDDGTTARAELMVRPDPVG